MRQEAWRAYLELALGLTDASRKKATKIVRQALGKGGATADQLQDVAEELLKTSAANREAITKLVRAELDRALSRVGLATADEISELAARVRQLEAELADTRAEAAAAAVAVAVPVPAAEPFGGDVEALISEPVVLAADELGVAEQLAAVIPAEESVAIVVDSVVAAVPEPTPAEEAAAEWMAAQSGAVEPGAAEPAAAEAVPGRKAAQRAARKAGAEKATAAKATGRAEAEPVKKAGGRKATAAKATAAKATAAKATGQKAAAKKAARKAAGTGAADVAPAKKAPGRKATTGRAPAKKAPAKAPARKAAGGRGAGA